MTSKNEAVNEVVRKMTPDRATPAMVESLESRALFSGGVYEGGRIDNGGIMPPEMVPPEIVPTETVPPGEVSASAATKASVTALRVPATSTVGQAVTLRAGVAGSRSTGVPTGTVTFTTTAGVTLGTATLTDGAARLSTAALPLGKSTVVATYSGSGKFTASVSSARRVTVTQTAVANRLSVVTATETASAVFGTPVSLVARIANLAPGTGAATGRVAFYDNGVLIGSKRLNSIGAARLVVPNFFTGTHDIRAIYGGSATSLAQRSALRTIEVTVPTLADQTGGLRTATVVPGSGTGAAAGDVLTANYTGYLLDGTLFDTSLQEGRTPFQFQFGSGGVIAGFDQGLTGIRPGETRVLVIPPELGYGAQPNGNIPANSTLIFIVTALAVD